MMQKNRTLPALLMCAFVIAAFPLPSHAMTYLNVWHKEESEESKKLLKELLNKFAEAHDLRLDLVRIDPTNLTPTLLKNAREGTLPDVAFVPADLVGHYDELNLSDVPKSLQNPAIPESVLNTATIDGNAYAAPVLGGNHLMLYYNRKYITQPAKNWAEMRAQSLELKEKGVRTIGWFYSEPFWLVGFIPAFGGTLLSEGELSINTAAIRRTFEFYKALAVTGFIDNKCDYSCGAQQFFNGEVAYSINGDWAYEDGRKALGADFGVAMLPKVGEQEMRPMFSTTGLIFPDQSLKKKKKKEVLKKLISYLQSEEVQHAWFEKSSRFPVHSEVFDELESTGSANQQMALKQLRNAIMMPNDRMMAHIWQGLRKGMSRYLNYNMDIRDVLESTQRYIEYQNTKNP